MSNQLEIIRRDEWATIKEMGAALIATKFLPSSIQTAEQAVAIILTGRELGIAPMQALTTINVIQGKPTVSPQLMLALINRTGQLEDMRVETNTQGATCMMKRKGRQPYTAHFGRSEADAMNLSGKDNYKKQPATMYQWRAVAMAARVVFPDAILGLYSPEEMGADVTVGDTGEMNVVAEHAPRQLPASVETVGQAASTETGDLIHKIEILGEELGYTRTQLDNSANNKYKVHNGLYGLNETQLGEVVVVLTEKEKRATAEANDALARVQDAFNAQGWDEGEQERYLRDTMKFSVHELSKLSVDQCWAVLDDLAIPVNA
jgi:hypothetical protein